MWPVAHSEDLPVPAHPPQPPVHFEHVDDTHVEEEEEETFEHFFADCRRLLKNCGFSRVESQKESVLRDRIVFGVRDKAVQEALLRIEDLTLDIAAAHCRAVEQSRRQAKVIQESTSARENGGAVDVVKESSAAVEVVRKGRHQNRDPLRELMKSGNTWEWLPTHDNAFQSLKDTVAAAPVLASFDQKKKVTIQCDASQSGLGCCLMQEAPGRGLQPVAFASRSLTEYVQTDHKPLVPIMNKQISQIGSVRLQRLRLKLLRIVVPASLQPFVLELLHEGHLGIEKTRAKARQVFYWAGMSKMMEDRVNQCRVSDKFKSANPKQPLMPHEVPKLPFEKIVGDILDFGNVP
ncbi:uncharacterized protein LOC124167157 [Ischnura elegans]|uniref:uncharacterized protein LOC124167157 n=1 Tax=Ischnura elegans TaxID=197161 RepID=UPI001ED881D4|nr:uncharacterized protein LOC124167157 [Ischnura elegans]